ncbi:MAG: hypothetical protein ACYS22_15845, partial [Planctomycetota bacterium]
MTAIAEMTTLKTFEAVTPAAGPAWFANQRAAGAAYVAEHGLPTRKAEAWRYLDLRALSTLDFGVAEPKTVSDADLEPHLLGDASTIRMVFVDGVYS